ncbi:MAG: response regulator [Chitinophagaceae bacterium]|nr:response regulator [Chitinophagaceae bacterium]
MDSPLSPQKKKVLIIEDEGDMCLLLNIILQDEDHQVDHAKNLHSATQYLQTEKPEIVLLDNKLPDGFGVDFIQVVKKLSPSSGIIMLTGYDPSAGDVALENGADLFLTKPFTREQVTTAVNSLLNKEKSLA